VSTASAVARRAANAGTPHHGGGACASYGHVPHSKVTPALWEAGWLPRRSAAEAMNITVGELDQAVRAGAIRCRRVGPGAVLYQVVR